MALGGFAFTSGRIGIQRGLGRRGGGRFLFFKKKCFKKRAEGTTARARSLPLPFPLFFPIKYWLRGGHKFTEISGNVYADLNPAPRCNISGTMYGRPAPPLTFLGTFEPGCPPEVLQRGAGRVCPEMLTKGRGASTIFPKLISGNFWRETIFPQKCCQRGSGVVSCPEMLQGGAGWLFFRQICLER